MDFAQLRLLTVLAVACAEPQKGDGTHSGTSEGTTGSTAAPIEDTGTPEDDGPDPFADAVVSFSPGRAAGFGADKLPDIVLGAPKGAGGGSGSLDVLSLGGGGSIVLELQDITIVDEPGPDFLVFENPFPGWLETGRVSVSEDGETWYTFPCDETDVDNSFPGCAGVRPVYANPDANALDPTNPAEAGGDAFDIAELGLTAARFVRIEDTGVNPEEGNTGGFDLDAIAVVHGTSR